MNKLRLGLACLLSAAAFAGPLAASTIVLGGYPDQIQFVSESTGKVTEKVKLETGLPANIQLSADRSKIYVTTLTTSGIEVLDANTHKVLNRFSLNTPATRYRFTGGVPDPTGSLFYTIGSRIDKQIDLYKVSKPQFLVIDMKAQKVVRAVDIEEQDQGFGYRSGLAISPDGKTLFAFLKKVLVIDTTDFKVQDRIDLAKPDSPGLQDVNMGGSLESLRDPGEYISVFNSEDPYIHNKVFGIARFDLTSRKFSFKPIGPAPDQMGGLEVTPDGKDGYTVAVNGKLGNQRCEFWHFNLTTNAAVGSAEFPCRRRFYFGMSSDGKKLYIYGAGFDVAVYDAKTLKLEKDWELRNDITMAGILHVR
jgi:DNA-binding beta-propeller fold protein YncE